MISWQQFRCSRMDGFWPRLTSSCKTPANTICHGGDFSLCMNFYAPSMRRQLWLSSHQCAQLGGTPCGNFLVSRLSPLAVGCAFMIQIWSRRCGVVVLPMAFGAWGWQLAAVRLPPGPGRESWRGTQTKAQYTQRPGHLGQMAFEQKKFMIQIWPF